MKDLFEKHADWQVCGEAADGLDAVRKAADLRPDLVVLDLAMPKMDGLQSARLISGGSPEVAILMHTWHVSGFVTEQAEKNGIAKVVGKGTSIEDLLNVMEALLKERPARTPTERSGESPNTRGLDSSGEPDDPKAKN